MVLKYFYKNYKNDTNITIGKFQTAITKPRHSQHLMMIYIPLIRSKIWKDSNYQIHKIKEFKTIEMPKQGNQLS